MPKNYIVPFYNTVSRSMKEVHLIGSSRFSVKKVFVY